MKNTAVITNLNMNNIIKIIFLSMIILLTAGCVTNSKLIKPSDTNSIVEYTKKLKSDTSSGLDAAVVSLSISEEIKKYNDHITYKNWWCPRHKEVYGKNGVINQYNNFCNQKGGRYNPPFCVSRNNSDDVLFYAQVTNSRKCSGKYETADVSIIEPTGKRDSKRYMHALRMAGFKTSADLNKARSNARINELRNAAQQKRDAVKMRNIGTKICKKGRYIHVGFIERVATEKIQIRVANIHLPGRPDIQPGGFSPSIIWDYPQNWYVCE